jgi:hypothetical protein
MMNVGVWGFGQFVEINGRTQHDNMLTTSSMAQVWDSMTNTLNTPHDPPHNTT